MDISDSLVVSTSEDVSSYRESLTDARDNSESDLSSLSVNDLGSSLAEYLKIQNDQDPKLKINRAPDNSDDCHGTNLGTSAYKKCLEKSATFPCSSKAVFATGSIDVEEKREVALTTEVLTQNGHSSSVKRPYLQHSISLPTSLKLVSAMKGSREKQGKPTQKLSVTWAPDVYDPTPTSVSHVPSNNKLHRRRNESKKNGKNKHKGGGKSSRGSKSKDKKQTRKSGSHSNRCNSLSEDDWVVSSTEPVASIANYDISSPDVFCGSSFLKKSIQQLHFPVAEAS